MQRIYIILLYILLLQFVAQMLYWKTMSLSVTVCLNHTYKSQHCYWYILFSPFMSQSLWFGWKHLSLRSFMSISFCTRSSILAYTGTLWTHYSHTYKATPDIQAHSVAILKNPEAVSCLKKLSLMKLKPMLSKSFFWWYGVFKSL